MSHLPCHPGHALKKCNTLLAWLCLFTLSLAAASAQTPLWISEVLFNPPGGADAPNEYLELRGPPNAIIPAGTWFLAVEGDAGTNAGTIQNLFDLSGRVLGGNGFLILLQKGHAYTVSSAASVLTNGGSGPGWGSGSTSTLRHRGENDQTDLENAAVTFFLVQTTNTPAIGDDIDADNDGVPDGDLYASWTVLDSIGVLDADGVGDFAYGRINCRRKDSPGNTASATHTVISVGFTASYVARNGNSTGWATNDWVASDILSGVSPNWSLGAATNTFPEGRAGAA